MDSYPVQRHTQRGFSLLELAIAMTLVGLLMAGGVALFSATVENWGRSESRDYMEETVQSLFVYAGLNGRLPYADSSGSKDGRADSGVLKGFLPYLDLQVLPGDAWRRQLKYEVHSSLTTDWGTSCAALETALSGVVPPGLTGGPDVWDTDAGLAYPIAAIIVSGGGKDADGDGDAFDAIFDPGPPPTGGGNVSGTPYLRRPPDGKFDDLVATISAPILYRLMECKEPKSP